MDLCVSPIACNHWLRPIGENFSLLLKSACISNFFVNIKSQRISKPNDCFQNYCDFNEIFHISIRPITTLVIFVCVNQYLQYRNGNKWYKNTTIYKFQKSDHSILKESWGKKEKDISRRIRNFGSEMVENWKKNIYICCTLRSGLHEIPTMIRTFPHGLESNHLCKWNSDNFPGMLTYILFLYIVGSLQLIVDGCKSCCAKWGVFSCGCWR